SIMPRERPRRPTRSPSEERGRPMTEEISRIPGWFLVIPIFWAAAAFFGLAMYRHVRVFAAAHPYGGLLLSRTPRRVWAVVEHVLVQIRMFRDPKVALMHHAIFWGFVILTIGTANVVTGGLIQAIVGWPLDGLLWAIVVALENLVAVLVILGVLY